MKFYHIYKHSNGHIEAVKQGWSWPAFFFTFMWALIKKLWLVAGVIIGINTLMQIINHSVLQKFITIAERTSDSVITYMIIYCVFLALYVLVFLATVIFLGIKGNELREKNLINNGYTLVKRAAAVNPAHAMTLVLEKE